LLHPYSATIQNERGIVNTAPSKPKPKKVVLAYSGGLDTSIIIPWLKENYQCEVIAMIGDVGQQEDLEAARKKALATGASSAHVEDLREEFVRDYIWPTLRAGAVYEHTYLLGTSMARPILGKRQAEIALKLGADGLSHGCTGKGNDQVRFELAYKAIAPNLQIIAPWREWDIDSREDAIAYAQKHNVPVEQSKRNIYSRDRNIWHLSHEGGELEDPANSPNEAMWQWISSAEKAPDKGAEVEIGFEAGVPVSVNGTKASPVELLNMLNEVAAKHGIGRTDIVENRLVGMKSRGAYETPGGTLLVIAHRELEALTVDRETAHFQQALSLRYAELVYYGLWFSQRRPAARHRHRRPETLERHAHRHQARLAFLPLSHRPRQFHHGPLQSQRRRRLHQSFRAAGNRSAEGKNTNRARLVHRRGAILLRPS
jgi:argininosuccinate synthase